MRLIAYFLLVVFPVVAHGQTVDFDFESEAAGAFGSGVVFSSGDLDLVVTTPDFPNGFVHVFDTSTITIPSEFGIRALSGFENEIPVFEENAALAYEFSRDVRSATFLFGDGGGDDDGTASLELFDSNGNPVAVLTELIGTSGDALSITVNQTFRSAVFRTDGVPGPNSVVQEWLDVRAIPEPGGTVLLFGLTFIHLVRRRKD